MKKLTALFLSLLIALSVAGVSAFSDGGSKNGDVNTDGSVKIQDANLIQRYLAKMTTLDSQQMKLADYDMNGEVSIDDVTEIQMVLVEAKPEPTAPVQPSTFASETQITATTQPSGETESVTHPVQDEPAPNPKVSSKVRIYFSNNANWSEVYFYFYNSKTAAALAQWPGTLIKDYVTNDYGENVYYADVDTSVYDRVIFNNKNSQTVNISLSKASSGFCVSKGAYNNNNKALLVDTYAYTGSDSGKMTKLSFDYPDGYKKRVWIWTPSDYNAEGAKFRTIYMTDGQNLFDDDHEDGWGGWEVTDAIGSTIANGGRGVILVGIETTGDKRDTELTPDLGELVPGHGESYENGRGIQFADFVVNTIMPYVQNNYNSSAQRCDNLVIGSSSGGLEAFYIGMEHMDKFSMIGSLSPAFILFTDNVWNNYLSKFDLSSDYMPKLYLFNGDNDDLESTLRIFAIEMRDRLQKAGYKNMTMTLEDSFVHNEAYWRVIFPECISYLLDI